MKNRELKFRTNLNCGGCVSKVKEDLDTTKGIDEWHVDIENPNKILTIKSSGITELQIVEIINNKGFIAESIV